MAYNYGCQNPYQAPYQPQYGNPYQNQAQQPQPAQQPPQPAQGLSSASRPVTNREEAVSTPADFSGAIMVFPDLANNRIYLKRWNMQTGSADFGEFAPVVPAGNEQQKPAAFASLEDFQGLQETVSNLQKEIDRLKKPAASGKVVKKSGSDDE